MRFTTTLERDDQGQTYATVPEPLDELLAEDIDLLVTGWANDAPFQAHLAEEHGKVVVPLDPTVRLFAGDVGPGDRVSIEIEPSWHGHAEEIPADLLREIRIHPDAAERFDDLSPSQRRELIDWVEDERHPDSRPRRVVMAVAQLMRASDAADAETSEAEDHGR